MPSEPTPEPITFPAGGHVSPGLRRIAPDACFPFMGVGDKARHPWQYLRREIPHNWYVDSRSPEIGFVSRDEAHKSRRSRATV